MSALPGPSLSAPSGHARIAAGRLRGFAIGACLALPWLVGWAPGPSSNVVPWLVSAACGVLAWALARPVAQGLAPWAAGAAVLLGIVLLRAPAPLDGAAFGGGLVLLLAAASLAAGSWGEDGGATGVIARVWLFAATLSAAVALLQFFGLVDGAQPWLHAADPGEALGQLRQRNQLASLTAIGLAAALWLVAQPSGPRGAGVKAWLLPCVLLLAVANAATTSRTGLLAWLAVAALAALWAHPARRQRLALCAAGLAACAVAAWGLPLALRAATGITMPGLFTRVAEDIGCSSRRVLWDNVLHLVAQRPFLGWGWGELDYAHYATLYDGPRFCAILDNAHALPLHLAVELGLPVAVVLCGLGGWALARARPWREADATRQLAWSVLAVIGLHSLLEYPLWYGPFQLAAGLAVGLLLRPAGLPVRWPARLAALLAAAAALAYAGWDYARVSQVYLAPQERVGRWREDALVHARRSWLFAGPARFAAVTLTPVTAADAPWLWRESEAALHHSPEPRVIEKAVESAALLGRDEALLHLARFQAAFPQAYAAWRAAQGR